MQKMQCNPGFLLHSGIMLGAEPVTGYTEADQGFDGCSIIMQDCGKGPGEELVTGRRTAACALAPLGGGLGSCAGLRRQLDGCLRSGRSRY